MRFIRDLIKAIIEAIVGPPTPTPLPPLPPNPPVPTNEIEELLLAHNKERHSSIGALYLHTQLTRAAQKHADWMAKNHTLDHSENGVPFNVRITNEGYKFWTAGENIAMGQTTVKSVMQSWMNSPGHRANILNKSYTDVGFGVAESNGRKYWCADFASHALRLQFDSPNAAWQPGVFLSGPLGPEREDVNHLT